MNQQQFNQIKAMVLSMLRFGEYQQALGMLQGACAVTNLHVTYANGLDIDQLFEWVNLAGDAAIDRRFDDMQHQEWHDTQASLEASVQL
mgnify:CR=1 FL=1